MNPEHLLRVWYSETRLDPSVVNHASGARGISQILPSSLKRMGMSDADVEAFRDWPAERQLPWVERHLRGVMQYFGGPLPSASAYYAGNFNAPSLRRGTALDDVVAARDAQDPQERAAYRGNPGLDEDKDGTITYRDLEEHLNKLAAEAPYQGALARLAATAPEPEREPFPGPYARAAWWSSSEGDTGGSGLELAVIVAAAGAILWWSWGAR